MQMSRLRDFSLQQTPHPFYKMTFLPLLSLLLDRAAKTSWIEALHSFSVLQNFNTTCKRARKNRIILVTLALL